MRLIHITDPHLTNLDAVGRRLGAFPGKRWTGYLSWRNKRRHIHQRDLLDRLTAAVRRERPQQILLTGDLVHIGLPEEIEDAARWLAQLGKPAEVCLVPGNHDLYAADSWPAVKRLWREYLGLTDAAAGHPGDPYPVVRELSQAHAPPLRIIGLCSAKPTPIFLASGELGAGQRRRLQGLLEPDDAFHCVLLHHPPLPGMAPWRKALRDAGALSELFAAQPVQLVLHGHRHRNMATCDKTGMIVLGTASASCAAESAPASYRVFDIQAEADGWVVQMELKSLRPTDDTPVTIDTAVWKFPFRPTASAP